MVKVTANIDQVSAAALGAALNRAMTDLGKDCGDAVKWAGSLIARSLGAATRTAPKLRPIVKNPHPATGKDGRRALYGVMKYRADRSSYFVPIGRTGEYGKVRFVSKTTGETLVRDRTTGKVSRERFALADADVSGVKDSPKRVIGRRGLAKQSWTTLQRFLNRNGGVSVLGVDDAAEAHFSENAVGAQLRIVNNLRYIREAMQGGSASVDGSVARAAAGMQHEISRRVEARIARANAA
jgi:hypothetical protein